MDQRSPQPRKSEVVTGPAEGGLFREGWAHLRRPFVAAFWAVRRRWLLHRGVVRPRHWYNPWWTWLVLAGMALVMLAFLAWGFWDVWIHAFSPGSSLKGKPFGVPCTKYPGACTTGSTLVMPVVTLAIGTATFLVARMFIVRRHYARRMRGDAKRYVQTAGRLLDEVVGRDQLCHAIMNNLRDREARRPHVVVGRVGAGKTALMVRLAELLAAHGAIPVPVQLRDATDHLDFCELARQRFRTLVQGKVLTDAELDRSWRWLRARSDKIVVLADGLEEALSGKRVTGQRDTMIREAIRLAGEQGLPLVIASRPHGPLRAMEAAITDLEPLSDEVALRYVREAGIWRSDPVLLDRIVEVARVAESPLYLQITRDLHHKGRLEPLWRPGVAADPLSQDTWALRADLLEAWLDALVDGVISPELPIDQDTRLAAVEYLSALACLGLAADSAYVPLRALDPSVGEQGPVQVGAGDGGDDADGTPWRQPDEEWTDRVVRALDGAVDRLRPPPEADGDQRGPFAPPFAPPGGAVAAVAATGWGGRPAGPSGAAGRRPGPSSPGGRGAQRPRGPRMDVRLAATWGVRMGLVREQGEGIHFQHSIMQAYLGSRLLHRVLAPSAGGPPVLEVQWGMWVRATARTPGGEPAAGRARRPRRGPGRTAAGGTGLLPAVREDTGHLARGLHDGGREMLIALTLYSRSLDGQCLCDDEEPSAPCPVVTVRELLRQEARDLLKEAEEAERLEGQHERARRVSGDGSHVVDRTLDDRGSPRMRALDAYGAAVDIDSADLGPAHEELVREIRGNWPQLSRGDDRARLREAKVALAQQCGAVARRLAEEHCGRPAYLELFEIGRQEPDEQVRLVIAQEIGAGHDAAYRDVYPQLGTPWDGSPAPARPGEAARDGEPLVSADGSERERRARQRVLERKLAFEERWRSARETLGERERWWATTLRAWVLPMLVVSAPLTRHRGSPSADLEHWVRDVTRHAAPAQPSPPGFHDPWGAQAPHPGVHGRGERWAVGLALAKGMKFAANKRTGVGTDNREARKFLVKQARILLRESDFWYTRLTLLQALTLWELPDDVSEDRPIRGHGANPRALVGEWLASDEPGPEHPLVEAAGRLAVRALQTRRPERFLWIDEVSVASEVGTEVSSPGEQRAHNLWIPPSTGWSSLDPAAQQLLADVLLLVMLSERDYRPSDLMALYESGKHEWSRLPSCLSRDRTRLHPVRAVELDVQPGDYCTDDCRLRMCPYPAKTPPLRYEFTEVFCLRQGELLKRWQPYAWMRARFRREARWQHGVPVSRMRRFWEQMGRRARDAEPDTAGPHRSRSGR
ncbi:NACHT domain-containing protein [Streptomyces sp. HPF1205]|uniref:NACHT domain-containing protein n=1 Tax=Streptomyces sp. HPF1205 TaxID=2873262 RepID=UPI001CED9563|nr:NACHT domain-containing protein [Streptomyces sp. HPF1205]